MNIINIIGTATLFKREVWRFAKVWNQTVLAPVITSLLFLGVLGVAIGAESRSVDDIPFNIFVAPGLVMMAVIQNSFANTSSSLILLKIQGVIIDILMPPLKGFEITIAMVMGGVVRGLLVGFAVMLGIYVFVDFNIHNLPLAILLIILSSIFMALLGMLGGTLANSFDQMSAFTNYIITPLSFLSGTFYSIHRLPEIWQTVTYYNPFFYMIDGFRYAITGYSDASVSIGISFLIIANIILFVIVQYIFARGWRLKS